MLVYALGRCYRFGMFRVSIHALLCCAVLAAAAPLSAPAQGDDEAVGSLYERRLASTKTQKKGSILLRARMDNPEAQLAFADGLRARGEERAALKQYRALVVTWHGSPQAPQAQLATAELLEERGKYTDAFEEYSYLTRHYSHGYDYDAVLDRQFRIANHLMTTRAGGFLWFDGFRASERALPLFRALVDNAPNWERSHLAQFYIGVIHEEKKEYTEAVVAYESLFYRYPNSPHAAEASFRRAICLVNLANRSRNDEGAAEEAITALAQFLRWHPNDPKAATVREELDAMKERLARKHFEIAEFYEDNVDRPKSALVAYRAFVQRFPASDLTPRAEARILSLESERKDLP